MYKVFRGGSDIDGVVDLSPYIVGLTVQTYGEHDDGGFDEFEHAYAYLRAVLELYVHEAEDKYEEHRPHSASEKRIYNGVLLM